MRGASRLRTAVGGAAGGNGGGIGSGGGLDSLLRGSVSAGVARILDKVGVQCLLIPTTFSRMSLEYISLRVFHCLSISL